MLLASMMNQLVPGNGPLGMSPSAAMGMFPQDTGSDALVGNTVVLTPDQPEQSISMPAGFRSSNNGVLNVTFSVLQVEYPLNTSFYRNSVVAKIGFGAGGGGHTVEADIKNGTQISVVGQSPSLSAKLEDARDRGTPTKVTISASFGMGTRAARSFNTRTLPPRVVPPGETLFCKVPAFAFSFMPFAHDQNAFGPGASLVQFWSYAGTESTYAVGTLYGPNPPIPLTGALVCTLAGNEFSGGRLTEGMKLPQGADLLTITNQLDKDITWTPCFALSI